MTTRTYGKYRYISEEELPEHLRTTRRRGHAGYWALQAEPAVSMRAKRMFGRATSDRKGYLHFRHTVETARDLQWFIERYPLQPMDDQSADMLAMAAKQHREAEELVTSILAGDYQPHLNADPTERARDYQLAAMQLLRAVGGLLLTDEVGLGKTFTAALNFLHDDGLPALVVAPTHLASHRGGRWVEELDSHFPFLRYHVIRKGTPYTSADPRKHRLEFEQADVLITTYNKLDGWADALTGRLKYIVFDEVQDLRRGADSAKGVAAARIADSVPYRLGLTATPVYNYAGEAWNILDVINPGTLGSIEEFTREWGALAWGSHIKVANPAALGSYLREQGVMLGRTRKDVGRELPQTIKVTETVDSDPAALDAVAGDAAAMARLVLDSKAEKFERFRSAGELDMMMRQATGIGKAPYVAEFVRMLCESEGRVVLWGWHRAVYDIWLQRLADLRPVLYTGSESPTQKAAAVAKFTSPLEDWDDPDAARVLIMSLRSGAGVDGLQKHARVGVFGELDWSPQVHEQCIGRLRRDGMGTDPALAYFLVSEEGSDPSIAEVLQVKRQQGEQLVSPDGRLFDNATSDVNRTRLLAEAALRRAGGR
jgi:hypothetical protein